MSEFAGLNVGCGAYRTNEIGWINTDVVELPGNVEPDVVVSPDDPLPFEEGLFNKIYMGHVLEHVPWDRVVPFLELVRSKMADDGEVMVVCPDVNRTLNLWHEGRETLDFVKGVIEDDVHYQSHEAKWFGARHCWNAYEARIVRAMEKAGFTNLQSIEITKHSAFDGWPVVSFAEFQCAVKATK